MQEPWFDPQSAEHLSLYPSTSEPGLWGPQVATAGARTPRAGAPEQEKLPQGDTEAAWLES